MHGIFKSSLLGHDLVLTSYQIKFTHDEKKCEFLLIGTKKRLKSAVVEDVLIQNVPINRVIHLKYLGVVIDQHLDWAKHIDCIGKIISKDIYLMKRIRPYITEQGT